jgi:hypothetical protein
MMRKLRETSRSSVIRGGGTQSPNFHHGTA